MNIPRSSKYRNCDIDCTCPGEVQQPFDPVPDSTYIISNCFGRSPCLDSRQCQPLRVISNIIHTAEIISTAIKLSCTKFTDDDASTRRGLDSLERLQGARKPKVSCQSSIILNQILYSTGYSDIPERFIRKRGRALTDHSKRKAFEASGLRSCLRLGSVLSVND